MNTIQIDTREKVGKKEQIIRFFDSHEVKYIRSKLYVGDYTRLDNQTVCVDVKQDMQEVYSNLVSGHDRFRAECKRAQDAGIHLVILIQSVTLKTLDDVARWNNPRYTMWKNGKVKNKDGQRTSRPPVSSPYLKLTMETLSERYGVEWRFCNPVVTGSTICEILNIKPTYHMYCGMPEPGY